MDTTSNSPIKKKSAWVHLDMDGLNTIYHAHGSSLTSHADDGFYLSAVENSLEVFSEYGINATYFLIASDLDDLVKQDAVHKIVEAGHRIACHGYQHLFLDRMTADEKRVEICDAKKKIEDFTGFPCLGFRAPGYSLDYESLEMLVDAGYQYDSSVVPNYQSKHRLGVQRLFEDPFLLFPEAGFFEIPLPYLGPFLPPFHASYAYYLRSYYFRWSVNKFSERHKYLTMLFHLSDFSAPQKLNQSIKFNIYTHNYISKNGKQAFMHGLIRILDSKYRFINTEDFLMDWQTIDPKLQPRTILGISTTHETGACLVQDGKILAAVTEERLSRKKLDAQYPPVGSTREVIQVSGVDPNEIDAVAVAGLHWKDLLYQSLVSFWQDVTDYHAFNDYFPHFVRLAYRLFYFWRASKYDRILGFLRDEYNINPRVYYIEHHEAHASSAYRTNNAHPSLIVTADGVGDDICITFSKGEGSTIRRLESFFYPHSFGQFYTACTQILGFKGGRHEGKITGLAGFGTPNDQLIKSVEETIFNEDGFKLNKRYYAEGFIRFRWSDIKDILRGKLDMTNVVYRNYKMPLKKLLDGYKREDVAYAFQRLLEREMVRLSKQHINREAVHLSLAGGVFANVKLNMAMSHELDAESIYIFPAMGDGGLCVGAALSVNAPEPEPVQDMYLGTEYTVDDITKAVDKYPGLVYTRPDNLAETVADLLADKKIVARYDGRMEFGPRALGNRSILYYCGDKSVNDWLNKQLRRTEFMPFAPLCIYEDAEEYFVLKEGEKRACEYMTLVVACTDKMKHTCPAAVHVDGSARPQLVRKDIAPNVYEILEKYKALTGLSVLINTSFNMHEEPIVRSPEEAIMSFRQSNLDNMILGPYLVYKDSLSEN